MKNKIEIKIDKWIYETKDYGKTIYKRPFKKDGPIFLVLSFKYKGLLPACLN